MPDEVGSIYVSIGADLSQFQTQMTQAVSSATNAGTQIATAFNAGVQPVQNLTNSIGGLGDALGSLATRAVSIAGIEQLAQSSLEAYGNIQKATIALTALTGSAETAASEIQGLRDLANTDALSFPALLQANQRMTAFGISAQAIPGALRAAADAAAATGNSFDAITNSITRLAESGTAGARQLTQLGLSTKDLAAVMGVSADQVTNAFKALDPTARVEVIVEALNKYKGVAQDVADSISGQWQKLQNTTELAFEGMGQALAPFASALGNLANQAIPVAAKAISDLLNVGDQAIQFGAAFDSAAKSVIDGIPALKQYSDALDVLDGFARKSSQTLADFFVPGVDAATSSLKAATFALQALTDTGPQIDAMNKMMANGFAAAGNAAKIGGDQFRQAWNASLVQANLDPVTAGTKAVETEQTKLSSAVQEAGAALAQLNRHYQDGVPLLDGTKVSTLDLQIAQDKLKSATDALNNVFPTYKDTLSGLTTEYNKQVAEANTLSATIAQLLSVTDRSATQTALLADAESKLDGINKQLIGSTKDLTTAAQGPGIAWEKLTETTGELQLKAQGLVAQLGDAKVALDAVAASGDHTQAGQIALQLAMDQYTAKLKAAGVSENELITIQQNGVAVQTTAADMLAKLKEGRDSLTTSTVNGVTVLGQDQVATQSNAATHQSAVVSISAHEQAVRALAAAIQAGTQVGQSATDAELKYQTAAQDTINTLRIDAQAVVDLSNAHDNSTRGVLALQDAIRAYDSALKSAGVSEQQASDITKGLSDDIANLTSNATLATSAIGAMGAALDNADRSMAAFKSGASDALGSANSTALAGFLNQIDQVGSQLFGFVQGPTPGFLNNTLSAAGQANALNPAPTGGSSSLLPNGQWTSAQPSVSGGGGSSASSSNSAATAAQAATDALKALQTALQSADTTLGNAVTNVNALEKAYADGTASADQVSAAIAQLTQAQADDKTAASNLAAATTSLSTTQTAAATSTTAAASSATTSLSALGDALGTTTTAGEGLATAVNDTMNAYLVAQQQYQDGKITTQQLATAQKTYNDALDAYNNSVQTVTSSSTTATSATGALATSVGSLGTSAQRAAEAITTAAQTIGGALSGPSGGSSSGGGSLVDQLNQLQQQLQAAYQTGNQSQIQQLQQQILQLTPHEGTTGQTSADLATILQNAVKDGLTSAVDMAGQLWTRTPGGTTWTDSIAAASINGSLPGPSTNGSTLSIPSATGPAFGLPSSVLSNQSGSVPNQVNNFNFGGATISTQLAAQQLVAQVVTALRNQVRLSSGV